ncbi:MAG: ribbon-helix-helix protein, CopG family [Verrucomicrobia bacterium]|nr:ribbon-helix-helix protein, CopG family [Verrucomicrobiota bacterium]
MFRTQVYLTKKEREALAALARATGKKQSELIRQAVDRLIEQTGAKQQKAALEQAAGLWKERDDLPDFGTVRAEWGRG